MEVSGARKWAGGWAGEGERKSDVVVGEFKGGRGVVIVSAGERAGVKEEEPSVDEFEEGYSVACGHS